MNKPTIYKKTVVEFEPTFDQNDDAPLVSIVKKTFKIAILPVTLPAKLVKAILESPANDQSFRDPS